MIVPMTPSYADDGQRKKTGRILYENIKALHEQSERLKNRAACHGDPGHRHNELRRGEIDCPNAVQPRLKIIPVDCLSYCKNSNELWHILLQENSNIRLLILRKTNKKIWRPCCRLLESLY